MQVKEVSKKTEKRVLSANITTPSFDRTPITQNPELDEKRDYFSVVLFIGLAIFCATIFYISLKSLML